MNRLRSLSWAFALAAAFAPATAQAMPFFNHFYNETGYFLDVDNPEGREYRCHVRYDLTYEENGKTRSQVVEDTLTVPAKWHGRLVSFPSTSQSILRTYRYDIHCD